MTLPVVTVLLDNGSGTFPYDISKYVMFSQGFSYNRGREDWQGGVTPSQLSLTLNNSDGRFTVGSTLVASPSPIRVDQRIRLRETVNGTTFTRFTGYVKSWPTEWPATVGTFATSTITAVDAQSRAERHIMQPSLVEEILCDDPDGFWPLDDAVGSLTAAEKSGANSYPWLKMLGAGADVSFGATVPPGTEDATAATFAGGKYLYVDGTTVLLTPGYAVAFATSYSGGSNGLLELDFGSVSLYLNAAGALFLGPTLVSNGPYNDGGKHVVAVRYTSSVAATVYVDGTQVATGVSASAGSALAVGTANSAANPFNGTMANVAFWNTAPSAARMLSVSGVYVSELTSARVARLADLANISTGTIDAGLTTVPSGENIGSSTWDVLQQVVDAEGGVAFVNGSGTLDFHNRARAAAKTTPDLTLVAHQYVTPDVQPVDDDQQIVNYIETTSTVTGATQLVRSTLSEFGDGTATNPGHGRYPDAKSYLVSTDQEALDRANWIVTKFAEPTTRYGTLTLNLFAMPPAVAAQVLTALNINMWLRVTGMASQNSGGTTVDVVVQGWTEQATSDSWTVTCNVVKRSIYTALIIDDPVFGAIDQYPVYY